MDREEPGGSSCLLPHSLLPLFPLSLAHPCWGRTSACSLQEAALLIAGNLQYLELVKVIFQTRLIRLFFDQQHLLKQGQSLDSSTSRAVLGVSLSTCCMESRFVIKWQGTTGGIVKTFSNT